MAGLRRPSVPALCSARRSGRGSWAPNIIFNETSGEPALRFDLNLEVSAVPEPGTHGLMLLGLGLQAGLAACLRRQRG